MDTKICTKCNTQCKLSNFRQYSNKNYRSMCKKCDNEYDKSRKKEKRKERQETVFIKCHLCNLNKALKDFTKLKKHYKKKICLECYPNFLRTQKTEWCSNECKKNPNYRIKKSLAARLRTVMTKDTHTMTYIGCNIQYLREWFEYNFDSEMNWENYGTYWSIDHVIPVSKFDLIDENEKYKCWNWSNLVPVSTFKNSSKKNNLDYNQIKNIKDNLIKFKEEGSTTKWFSDKFLLTLFEIEKVE